MTDTPKKVALGDRDKFMLGQLIESVKETEERHVEIINVTATKFPEQSANSALQRLNELVAYYEWTSLTSKQKLELAADKGIPLSLEFLKKCQGKFQFDVLIKSGTLKEKDALPSKTTSSAPAKAIDSQPTAATSIPAKAIGSQPKTATSKPAKPIDSQPKAATSNAKASGKATSSALTSTSRKTPAARKEVNAESSGQMVIEEKTITTRKIVTNSEKKMNIKK